MVGTRQEVNYGEKNSLPVGPLKFGTSIRVEM